MAAWRRALHLSSAGGFSSTSGCSGLRNAAAEPQGVLFHGSIVPFPNVSSVPGELVALSGPCGPVSVWMVLERHGVRASAEEIIRRSRYTEEFGCFAVCMTAAFGEFGLNAYLCTDVDASPKEIEQICYSKVRVQPAVSVEDLLQAVKLGSSVIVSYLEDGDEGHFSPLSGQENGELVLPYSKRRRMPMSEFERRWQADEILRQAIVISWQAENGQAQENET